MIVFFVLLNARSGHASCSFNPSPDPTVDGSPNSLRTAIEPVNASGQDCTITLAAGTYTLTIKNTHGHEVRSTQGDLNITGSGYTTMIIGAAQESTIIDANHIDRAFQVGGGAHATFANLTIENGLAQDDGTAGATPARSEAEGGGILVQKGGNVTLSNVSLTGNQAIGGRYSPARLPRASRLSVKAMARVSPIATTSMLIRCCLWRVYRITAARPSPSRWRAAVPDQRWRSKGKRSLSPPRG